MSWARHLQVAITLIVLCAFTTGAKPNVQLHTVVYEPVAADAVLRFYADGQPVAVVCDKQLPVLLRLETDEIASRSFLKVWTYVLNLSEQTVELIPQNQIALSVLDDSNRVVSSLPAQTPSTMMKRIDDEKNTQAAGVLFASVLSGIASAVSTKDTKISSFGAGVETGRVGDMSYSRSAQGRSETTLHDYQDKLAEKLERNGAATQDALVQLEAIYANMKASVSAGLLRRNTLHPERSANGNVFFEFGRVQRSTGIVSYSAGPRPEELRYAVTIAVEGMAPVRVLFVPVPGE